MSIILHTVWKGVYDFLFEPGVGNRFLSRHNAPVPLISLSYLVVTMLLQKLMQKREPFNLRYTILAYNAMLVVLNASSFYKAIDISFYGFLDIICPDDIEMKYAALKQKFEVPMWGFFLLKIVECFDTIFFILRKKNQQVTFLHVYHHSFVILTTWAIAFTPTFSLGSYVAWIINSAVHVVMYTYYFLAACGPSTRKFLWWKKYLTTIQIIQFVLILVSTGFNVFSGCWRMTPAEISLFVLVAPVLILFLNFYRQEYLVRKVKSDHLKR